MKGTCLQHSYMMLIHLRDNEPEMFKKAKLCQGILNGIDGNNPDNPEKTDGFHCWVEIGGSVFTQAFMDDYEDDFIKAIDNDKKCYRFKIDLEVNDVKATAVYLILPKVCYYGLNDDGSKLVQYVKRWDAKLAIHIFHKHDEPRAFTDKLMKAHMADALIELRDAGK